MLRTTVIDHPSALAALRPLWEELHRAGKGTLFQSFVWNETAARVFARREPIRVVVSASDSGAAILPACIAGSVVSLIGETLFDYRDSLATDASLVSACLARVAEWDQPLQVTAVRGRAIDHWPEVRTEPFANAPATLVDSISAEAFVKEQNRLGRHSRRIRKHGIELHRYAGSDRRLVSEIYRRKGSQGARSSNLFADALRACFMEEICASPDARCEIFTYEIADQLVAALVTFRDRSWRRFYTVYYDERWASFSPGQVLLFEITAESLAAGLDCDYMTGEYPYKMRLATDSVPLYRVTAEARDLRANSRNRITPSIAA